MEKIPAYFLQVEDSDERQRKATRQLLLNALVVALTISSLVAVTDGILQRRIATIIVLGTNTLAALVSLFLLLRNVTWPARVIVPTGSLVAVSYLAFAGNGIHDTAVHGYGIVLLLAGLTLGSNAVLLFGGLSAAAVVVIGAAEMSGKIPGAILNTGAADITIVSGALLSVALLLRLALVRLDRNIALLRSNGQALAAANAELKELQTSLETRVADRTAELEEVYQGLDHRVRQFRAMAQVARTITAIQELNSLLGRLTVLISQQFDFYHTGIFLLDEKREYASLVAANSAGGLRMIERRYKVRVGEAGIVANVAATGTPRVVLKTEENKAYFDNPDLPQSRSQMALPLRVGRQIIGVLDVHSQESGAFTQDDIAVFSSMADQIAIAIQNARLYQNTQQLLAEAQRVTKAQAQEAWEVLQSTAPRVGYRISGDLVEMLDKPLDTPEIKRAVMQGEIIAVSGSKDSPAVLSVPLRMRGEVVGVTSIRLPQIGKWDNDNIDIIQAVTERLSLAIENATLLQASQRRAARERAISEISARIGAASEVETIMQYAVGELRRALGATEVALTVESDEQATTKA